MKALTKYPVEGKLCLSIISDSMNRPVSEWLIDDICFPKPNGKFMSLGTDTDENLITLFPFVDYIKLIMQETVAAPPPPEEEQG